MSSHFTRPFRAARAMPILLICSVAAWAEEPARIAHREKITNFFADTELVLHLDVATAKPTAGRLQWSLSAGERTLVRREAAVDLQAGRVATVEVRYRLPPVKQGVIFPIRLQAALKADPTEKPLEFEETLYLFAPNPFVDRTQWLEKLELHVFDPEESTASALDALEVPYRRVTNLESLTELTKGVVIVGEGVSWAEYGELARLLLSTAARGVPVLCLSPSAAEFPLPVTFAKETAAVSGLSLRRRDVIREFDKRFSLVWEVDRATEARELAMVVDGEKLIARAGEPGQGWPWLQISYAPGTGKLTWCGFGMIRSWDKSPTARYLLERLLQTYSPEAIKSESSAKNPLN